MLVKLAMALTLMLLVGARDAAAQGVDLSQALVGTWKGDVQMATGTYSRTLVIKSVQSEGRRAIADAAYGGPGGYGGGSAAALEPVDLQIEQTPSGLMLRFRAEDMSPVELSLYRDGRHLIGSVLAPSVARGGARTPAPIKLQKVE
jgi:hypothetical protein